MPRIILGLPDLTLFNFIEELTITNKILVSGILLSEYGNEITGCFRKSM
jgi:hypothetical protein